MALSAFRDNVIFIEKKLNIYYIYVRKYTLAQLKLLTKITVESHKGAGSNCGKPRGPCHRYDSRNLQSLVAFPTYTERVLVVAAMIGFL